MDEKFQIKTETFWWDKNNDNNYKLLIRDMQCKKSDRKSSDNKKDVQCRHQARKSFPS